jgi:hypothetical protein
MEATATTSDGSVSYVPPLGDLSPERIQPPHAFVDWWNGIVLRDQKTHAFTRRDLVLAVADQDGGAHVDAQLDEAYAELTRANSLQHTWGRNEEGGVGFMGFVLGDGPVVGHAPANSIALAHIRQIAWETLDTLRRHLVNYVRAPICALPFDEAASATRNERCPCGSGRKFKHCFGRRQPRRRLTAASSGVPQ